MLFKMYSFLIPKSKSGFYLTLVIGLGIFSGCQKNTDDHTPDGALRQFALFLSKGDEVSVYQSLSLQTHESLKKLSQEITQVEVLINQFPSKYRKWARQKALGTLSPTLEPRDLFFAIIKDKWKWIQTQDHQEISQGLNTKKVIKETGARATLSTRTGLTYDLIKEKGTWKLSSFEDTVAKYIQTLKENQDIMRENMKELKHRKRLNLPLPQIKSTQK